MGCTRYLPRSRDCCPCSGAAMDASRGNAPLGGLPVVRGHHSAPSALSCIDHPSIRVRARHTTWGGQLRHRHQASQNDSAGRWSWSGSHATITNLGARCKRTGASRCSPSQRRGYARVGSVSAESPCARLRQIQDTASTIEASSGWPWSATDVAHAKCPSQDSARKSISATARRTSSSCAPLVVASRRAACLRSAASSTDSAAVFAVRDQPNHIAVAITNTSLCRRALAIPRPLLSPPPLSPCNRTEHDVHQPARGTS